MIAPQGDASGEWLETRLDVEGNLRIGSALRVFARRRFIIATGETGVLTNRHMLLVVFVMNW